MPLIEIGSAFISSLMISPFMTIIDLSLLHSQYYKENLLLSCNKTINNYFNKKILKPLFIMNNVYFSTYLSANLTEYCCKSNNIDYKIPTLIITSSINIIAIILKDKKYSLYFNNKIRFGLNSFLLFALRDSITIGSCFIIKKDVINKLDKYNNNHNFNDFFASLFVPSIAQIINSPIHILAIDYAQRPNNIAFNERIKLIKQLYKNILFGRIIRILPAFGIGGFFNDMMRSFRYHE